MSLGTVIRKVFLCIALGGHSALGIGMSPEKIEELLRAMNQTRAEVSVDDEEEALDLSKFPRNTAK
jgi:hypothetical protein